MPTMKRNSQGPAEFRGGKVFVEQELGTMDTPMNPGGQQGNAGSGVPEHMTGQKFGGNLLEKDPNAAYNPQGRASPGVPTHVSGHRFGNDQMLPDKTPKLNPGG